MDQLDNSRDFVQLQDYVSSKEESQVNTLIYTMGDKADDILFSFRLSKEDQLKYLVVQDKFGNPETTMVVHPKQMF